MSFENILSTILKKKFLVQIIKEEFGYQNPIFNLPERYHISLDLHSLWHLNYNICQFLLYSQLLSWDKSIDILADRHHTFITIDILSSKKIKVSLYPSFYNIIAPIAWSVCRILIIFFSQSLAIPIYNN